MAAGKFNITIDIGSRFEWLIGYDDPDGAMHEWEVGDFARMQVRPKDLSTPILDLDSDTKGGIELAVFTVADYSFNMKVDVPATDTEDLPRGRHLYDLEIVPGGVEADAKRILQGIAYVSPQVTDG